MNKNKKKLLYNHRKIYSWIFYSKNNSINALDIKIKSVIFINYTYTFAFGICPDISKE